MSACTSWIFAVSLLVLGGCADRLLLFPPAHAVAGLGVARRTVAHDGNTIEIFTARSYGAASAEPQSFMLEFTGNMTRAEEIVAYVASRWGHRSVEMWVVNYPGYGKSTGGARLRNIPPAALAAYDELRRVAGGRPIFVAGQSLGSIAALYVASQRPVAGVVVQNPPSLPDQIWRQHGWWNLWLLATPVAWQIPREMNSVTNARRVTAPGLFIIAGADRVVPPRFQWDVANAFAGERRLIVQEGGTHVTPLSADELSRLQEGLDWLFDRATATRPAPAG